MDNVITKKKQWRGNTLRDISRGSRHITDLIKFIDGENVDILLSRLAGLEGSDPIEAIEAYDSDLSSTVNKIERVFDLIKTVDNQGNVAKIKGEEKNLSRIFGDNYDHDNKRVNFNTFTLDLRKNKLDKEIFKEAIVEKSLGISYSEYKTLRAGRKSIFKLNKENLITNEEKMIYLSTTSKRKRYAEVLSKISELKKGWIDVRSKISKDEREAMDEITFNRAMVDSFRKDSTIFIKNTGFEQVSSFHRKDPVQLARLSKLVKESKYFEAVELDKDTSLEDFCDLLEKTNKLNFKITKPLTLKVIKLGNYKANGLYMDSMGIVAVDLNSPSALIHEMVHAADYSVGDSQKRQDFANLFREHIDLKELKEYYPTKVGYYTSTVEIIARMGEISYLLLEFDYKKGEGIDNFIKRVEGHEDLSAEYLSLVKSIKTYTDENPNIYFNLKSIPEEDLLQAKEFYKQYMGVDGVEPVITDTPIINHNSAQKTGRKIERFEMKDVSLLNPETIDDALDACRSEGILEMKEFFEAVVSNLGMVGRTQKNFSNRRDTQIISKTIQKMQDWVLENGDDKMVYDLADTVIGFADQNVMRRTHIIKEILDNGIKISADDAMKENYAAIKEAEIDLLEIRENYSTEKLRELTGVDMQKFLVDERRAEESLNIELSKANRVLLKEIDRNVESIQQNRDAIKKSLNLGYTSSKRSYSFRQSYIYDAFDSAIKSVDDAMVNGTIGNLLKHGNSGDNIMVVLTSSDVFSEQSMQKRAKRREMKSRYSAGAAIADPYKPVKIHPESVKSIIEVAKASGLLEKALYSKGYVDTSINMSDYSKKDFGRIDARGAFDGIQLKEGMTNDDFFLAIDSGKIKIYKYLDSIEDIEMVKPELKIIEDPEVTEEELKSSSELQDKSKNASFLDKIGAVVSQAEEDKKKMDEMKKKISNVSSKKPLGPKDQLSLF